MSGGGASLTIHTTPWERQRVELMKTYGTTDIDEAIRRENKIEEMKHMEGKCEACGGKFDYDGRRHKKPPEKCSDCGGPEGCIPMMFDPPPEEPIDVPVRRRKGCCIPGCPEPRSERKDSHRCIKHQREYDRERTSASRARKTKPEMPPPGTPMPDPTEDTRPVPEDYRPPIEPANPLLDAFDRFQADCRKIFIARQNQHGKSSILDVTLEDLVGVHRLKGARIKQQVKAGVLYPEVLHDSLIDNAVYCFILWAVSNGEWEKLEWKEVA